MITAPRQDALAGIGVSNKRMSTHRCNLRRSRENAPIAFNGGRCVGIDRSARPSSRWEFVCLGTPTRTVRHLHSGRWLYASEGFAVTNRTAIHPRLHALIGNVAADVPEDLAREIACALEARQLPPSRPTFLSCLDAIRSGDDQTGRACSPQTLSATGFGSLDRSLAALNAVLDLLHAAERARMDGDPQDQLGDFHRDGLIVAARQIARAAQDGLGDALAPAGARLR